MDRFLSLAGFLAMLLLAWLLGPRSRPSLRLVVGASALQLGLAVFVLETPPGRELFAGIGTAITRLLGFVDDGTRFLFGPDLASLIAFKILPTLVFFSVLTAIGYHLRVLPIIVRAIGWAMSRTLGTSGAESLAAAANIFVGPTEAPLAVRPYLEGMTRSELMSLLVGGFATIAGGVLAVYVAMGIDATHLVTASVISAPAALLVAKLLVPEREEPPTSRGAKIIHERETRNVFHAVTVGATEGVRLAVNVGAMLLVFVALVALANAIIGGVLGEHWTLERIFGHLFAPIAWLLGVPWDDCGRVGELLGIKVVLNEFLAYERLAEWQGLADSPRLTERSEII
ncbi:MAG TPA: nucleoside transporter C-terminal domain-containing protein, partial [Planctomycetota bacterium]|nr:nucleoside transporter C-terminal domain-containing protein [Planctomycetota bacterium]